MKRLLDACLAGAAIFAFLILIFSVCFSAYMGFYVTNNYDRVNDEIIRVTAHMKACVDRFDAQALHFNRKLAQFEKASKR
jgi:hypothetical protein